MCVAAEQFYHIIINQFFCQIKNIFAKVASKAHDIELKKNASVFQFLKLVKVAKLIKIPFRVSQD